jgi:hypothetical protein
MIGETLITTPFGFDSTAAEVITGIDLTGISSPPHRSSNASEGATSRTATSPRLSSQTFAEHRIGRRVLRGRSDERRASVGTVGARPLLIRSPRCSGRRSLDACFLTTTLNGGEEAESVQRELSQAHFR